MLLLSPGTMQPATTEEAMGAVAAIQVNQAEIRALINECINQWA